MPYIPEQARAEILGLERGPETVGELTFVLTAMVVDYIERKGGPTYSVLAEAKIAAFDTALELHDRVSRGYEDLKCEVNGDVFGPILDLTASWPVGHGDPPPNPGPPGVYGRSHARSTSRSAPPDPGRVGDPSGGRRWFSRA